ncbi:hypothetical protein OKW76_04375 [Sphingomonas sp. S1-29]|uniref:WD40/YVTN/BNR-like repeat-containing protein n=1 Tax=Sphingomonas sp. S1-29 TaxID=2991074 RepID=UPI0022400F57|nr:hypothetical protein [Sphingomonas sp. S1-29]UZK70288.1 hypothetical protein OKW76_04375 [Sphingomonas sp. S1-29]
MLHTLRLLFAPLLALAIAPATAADPEQGSAYRWRNVTVGAGGFAPNLVFSPIEPRLAYLRTDMGGAYRWDGSADRWIPLQDGLAEGSYMGVESIAADPVDRDRVYLAAGMYRGGAAAILRSDNRGADWTITPVGFAMGGNEDGRGLGERLAIDPHAPATLLFGSRHDGLQRSDDRGATWRKLRGFPYAGLGAPEGRRTHAGIAFIVFDPRPGRRTVFAGVADKSHRGMYRSNDGGTHWAKVAGGEATLLPVKAVVDRRGRLFVAYANGIGPNGVTDGAVWRYAIDAERWSDITPDQRANRPEGGYMGLSVAGNTVAVSTMNRWQPGDTLWRSTDGGDSWVDIGARSARDVRTSPFLRQGQARAEFGHWIAGVAIDSFDPRRIAYTTGATVYATADGDAANVGWKPWVRGIEQTAIITLASPGAGAPLVSGFGDIAGFVHDDLEKSPPVMHLNPHLTNTNNLDWAGKATHVLVRSGNRHAGQPVSATLAWSDDGGHRWKPVVAQLPGKAREDLDGNSPIVVAADGKAFLVSTPTPLVSADRGARWQAVQGLPGNTRVVADKVDARVFYAADYAGGRFLRSNDGGRSFVEVENSGLPDNLSASAPRNRESPLALLAEPGRAGHLWLRVGDGLWRSTDGGDRFVRAAQKMKIDIVTLGKAAPGAADPAVFAWGSIDAIRGLYRSTDGGQSWTRINDDAHRWGNRIRVIVGDPKRFGRLYVGTDGRGIVYGDPVD